MKATQREARVPLAGSAVAVAVCAAFATAPAGATEVIIPIDVLLSGQYNLDINGDSLVDFSFGRTDAPPSFVNSVFTVAGSGIVGTSEALPKPGNYATLLGSGEVIDGSRTFITNSSAFLSGFTTNVPGGAPFGHFYDQSGFLGLTFQLGGAAHYGWVEIHDQNGDLTLVRAGYETDARGAITTPGLAVPEPGSLALLIAGAAGVLAMRRRKRAA